MARAVAIGGAHRTACVSPNAIHSFAIAVLSPLQGSHFSLFYQGFAPLTPDYHLSRLRRWNFVLSLLSAGRAKERELQINGIGRLAGKILAASMASRGC